MTGEGRPSGDPPRAPWLLSGEVVVAFVRQGDLGEHGLLPDGLRRLPGPAVLWAGHWAQTPVGPFSELAVAVPARLGPRPGLSVTFSVVTNADARLAGRLDWGLPRQLGSLHWVALGHRRQLTWDDAGVDVAAAAGWPSAPFLAVLRSFQRGADGPLVVPARLRGWVRRATVTIDAQAGGPFSALVGSRRGWLVSGRQVVLDPSRAPIGRFGTRRLAPMGAATRAASTSASKSSASLASDS